MARKREVTRKSLIKLVTDYGFHIWVILLVANIALVYTFHFSSQANNRKVADVLPSQPALSQIPSEIVEAPTPTATPTPVGPVIAIALSLPGISSQGGNMRPLHTARSATVYLYDPNVNSELGSIKPLYSIDTKVTYDDNPMSPTYTQFVNPYIDLGSLDGTDYQIVIKTDQTVNKLVKVKEDDVGGQIFKFSNNAGDPLPIPSQTMILGDIYPPPHGDGVIDIQDYNMLVFCFQNYKLHKGESCPSKDAADLNDDGVVDGLDYNLMARSFQILLTRGYPVPSLEVTRTPQIVTPVPSKKEKPKPSPVKGTTKTASSGGLLGTLFVILLLGGLGAGVYFYLIKKPTGISAAVNQDAKPAVPPPASNTVTEGDYFIKKKSVDEKAKTMILSLTGDSGAIEGVYKGPQDKLVEGFAHVKGTMKTDKDKQYLEISEISSEV